MAMQSSLSCLVEPRKKEHFFRWPKSTATDAPYPPPMQTMRNNNLYALAGLYIVNVVLVYFLYFSSSPSQQCYPDGSASLNQWSCTLIYVTIGDTRLCDSRNDVAVSRTLFCASACCNTINFARNRVQNIYP
jgi:hypothetical protein